VSMDTRYMIPQVHEVSWCLCTGKTQTVYCSYRITLFILFVYCITGILVSMYRRYHFYVQIRICIYVCVYTYIHLCVSVYSCTRCVIPYMRYHFYVQMCMYILVYVYMCLLIYGYVYLYTHAQDA